MKTTKPAVLSVISALLVTLLLILLYLIHVLFVDADYQWISFIILILFVGFSVYFVNKYILEKFIYDRIKLIYKNIHSQKLSKEEKQNRLNQAKGDAIATAGNEVMDWAHRKTEEIEQLKKLETFRKEFLGNVSHELKTPITNIQGYILTLLGGASKDAVLTKDYLEKTERNIERMISIVDELETISRYETGEIVLEKVHFDIVSLTREVFEFLEPMAVAADIKLFISSANNRVESINVYADRFRIRQVLSNLLANSIKYGNKGGRTKVSFYDMDEHILIEVSDNGIGIAPEHLPRLFERFYRVDKSRSRQQGGSGLGLSIVKHILEAHKQTINVRSTKGLGTTFSFTLSNSEK
jgi:two-component system phosphate regulon sensor histidine kinase PhoR